MTDEIKKELNWKELLEEVNKEYNTVNLHVIDQFITLEVWIDKAELVEGTKIKLFHESSMYSEYFDPDVEVVIPIDSIEKITSLEYSKTYSEITIEIACIIV